MAEGGGNILAAKVGPLPVWAWAGIILGAYLLYEWYESRQAASSADTGSTTSTADNTGLSEGEYDALAAGIDSIEQGEKTKTVTKTTGFYPGRKKSGSGYDIAEPDFTHAEGGEGHRALAMGIPVYYEPQPGQLERVPGHGRSTGLAKDTPLFILSSDAHKVGSKPRKTDGKMLPAGKAPAPKKAAVHSKVKAGAL